MKNLILTITIALFLVACSDSGKDGKQTQTTTSTQENTIEQPQKDTTNKEKSIGEIGQDIAVDAKKAMDNVISTTKDEFNKVYENNKENINNIVEKTKEQSNKIIATAQESVKDIQKATENFTKEAGAAIEKTIKETKEIISSDANDTNLTDKNSTPNPQEEKIDKTKNLEKEGEKKLDTMFDETTKKSNPDNFNKMSVSEYYDLRCSSCHGQYADTKALNKSAIIGTWDAKDISQALHGYKDGTYGGNFKKTMYVYAKNLNDEEIEQLSQYISNF